jgi:hypothetical protein
VRKLFVAFTLLIATAVDASAQILLADAQRDRPLYTSLLAFLNDTIAASQLEAELREYARAFEARPYKVGRAPIEWSKFPQERVFAVLGIIGRITARVACSRNSDSSTRTSSTTRRPD